MLSISPDLATAYYLKELFYEFMNSQNRNEAKQKLQKFILSAQASNLDEFKPTLTMLANWGKYILNACFPILHVTQSEAIYSSILFKYKQLT